MIYKNLDPLPNGTTVELYRDRKIITDVYNGCVLSSLSFGNNVVTLKMRVVHEAGFQKLGTIFTIRFEQTEILSLDLEGETLDDMGQLKHISIDNSANTVTIVIADSLAIKFRCTSISIAGI